MHRGTRACAVVGLVMTLLMASGAVVAADDEQAVTNAELLKELREMKQRIQILEQQVQQARQGAPTSAAPAPRCSPPAEPRSWST